MVKSKVCLSLMALLLMTAVVLSGCTSSKTPKEALEASFAKSSDIKSYSFKGTLKVNELNLPDQAVDEENSFGTSMGIKLLKNADLSWTGVYQAEPMMSEVNLSLMLKGDMPITINIPVVMNDKKIWVKIPSIPIFPLPDTITNKFLELDLEQLAKESGQPIPKVDQNTTKKLGNDVLGIVFNNVEEKDYLSSIKPKEAGLPEDAGLDQAIQLHVTKEQLEPFIKTAVEKIAPEIIDLLSKNQAYKDAFQLKQEDLDKYKKELSEAQSGDLSKKLEEMKKTLKALDLKANIGIDGDDYPVYTDFALKAGIEQGGKSGNIDLKAVSQMSDINKEVKFTIGVPKDIITMEQLQEQLGGLFGNLGGIGQELEGAAN
ncbi:hypothetical protein ACFPVX_05115 [Cohnella faecalis]|uniref:Uncharacterized protein n=1 Tax=Cohnella faecalis TaxID=2315694 RepID=A0A398CDQ2_9BACL|nr:hypothetical protein [Cohnella faecalis]RIE01316.1 hypothetical protein D3H35_23325 [Cohnella faecalis]